MAKVYEQQLEAMTLSIQGHLKLARELDLDFVANLLSMAVMEIQINLHGISQRDLNALRVHLEESGVAFQKLH